MYTGDTATMIYDLLREKELRDRGIYIPLTKKASVRPSETFRSNLEHLEKVAILKRWFKNPLRRSVQDKLQSLTGENALTLKDVEGNTSMTRRQLLKKFLNTAVTDKETFFGDIKAPAEYIKDAKESMNPLDEGHPLWRLPFEVSALTNPLAAPISKSGVLGSVHSTIAPLVDAASGATQAIANEAAAPRVSDIPKLIQNDIQSVVSALGADGTKYKEMLDAATSKAGKGKVIFQMLRDPKISPLVDKVLRNKGIVNHENYTKKEQITESVGEAIGSITGMGGGTKALDKVIGPQTGLKHLNPLSKSRTKQVVDTGKAIIGKLSMDPDHFIGGAKNRGSGGDAI